MPPLLHNLPAGHFAWHFARGKLGGDPAFLGLLERGLIPDNARILDLGCGQGLLASWLLSARALFEAGNWPAHWPAAPKPMAYRGVELMPCDMRRARRALGERAEFVLGDIRAADFGKFDAVVILDVLHYIDYSAQDDVLLRVRDALVPAGALLMRVGDADGGLPFRISNWADHLVTFARCHRLSFLVRQAPQVGGVHPGVSVELPEVGVHRRRVEINRGAACHGDLQPAAVPMEVVQVVLEPHRVRLHPPGVVNRGDELLVDLVRGHRDGP